MSSVLAPEGDFTGWSKVVSVPGVYMAWNWLPMLNLYHASAPTFIAKAIGLYDEPGKPVAVRTPPWVPNSVVGPVIALVMREQGRGVPIAISLTDEHDCFDPEGGHLAVRLHAQDPETLDRYFDELVRAMDV